MEDQDIINHKMDEQMAQVASFSGKIKMNIEILRNKVSIENANIIKQKVNQDVAIWDLKEKLKQERNLRDKMQHDLIELQMQYETISGKYQEELRLRADTLNKVKTNRKTAELLENYDKYLRDTLQQCEKDKASFSKTYQHAAENVRNLSLTKKQEKEKNFQILNDLQNQVAEVGEQEQRQLESISTQQSINSYLQTEVNELKQQLNQKANEAQKILMQQDIEIKKNKEDWKNQEINLKNLTDQNISLEKELNDMIEKTKNALADITDLKQQLQETNIMVENTNGEIEDLLQFKHDKLQEINNKKDFITSIEKNIKDIKDNMSKMEADHNIITLDLNKDIEDLDTKYKADMGELEIQIQYLNKRMDQLKLDASNLRVSTENKEKELMEREEELKKEFELKASVYSELIAEHKIINIVRETLDNKLKELDSTIEERNKDIELKVTCIKDLMNEVSKEGHSRSVLENEIDQLKNEKEEAFDQLKKLQNELRDEEEVSSKKMILLVNNARIEKEKLQSEIQHVENALENIRKDMVPSAVRFQAAPTHTVVESEMNIANRKLTSLQENSLDSAELYRPAPSVARETVSPVTMSTIKRKYEAAIKASKAKVPRSPKGTHANQDKPHKFFKNRTTKANKKA